MKNVVSVSIPRSGHHFLESLLVFYFRDGVHYCKRFEGRKCCNAIPCAWANGAVAVQKSHELDLALEQGLPGTYYFAQYRHPVPQVLSYSELVTENRPTLFTENDADWIQWWLVRRAAYYIGFADKFLQVMIRGENLLAIVCQSNERLIKVI